MSYKIWDTTPAKDGFMMPGEFEEHDGCIIIWPERGDSWQDGAVKARAAFTKVIGAISKSEKVLVAVSEEQRENAGTTLKKAAEDGLVYENIRLEVIPTDDAWARDYGPTYVVNRNTGEVRGVNWEFNAWGGMTDGLYYPWDKDNALAGTICDITKIGRYDAGFVLEGGSIHVDGEGTAMVTESCLLSKGRNPDLSKEQIEEKLKEYLGVSKVLWLPYGIYLDETNEHVDNICAFVKPGEVVLAWTEDKEDPQYAMSAADLEYLERERDAKGRKLKIHKLILPKPVTITKEECDGLADFQGEPTRTPGERLAASYVNFYISNDAIVMPGFGTAEDEGAKNTLQQLFPERRVIQIYARDILIGGGNIHCITQQIIKGGMR